MTPKQLYKQWASQVNHLPIGPVLTTVPCPPWKVYRSPEIGSLVAWRIRKRFFEEFENRGLTFRQACDLAGISTRRAITDFFFDGGNMEGHGLIGAMEMALNEELIST